MKAFPLYTLLAIGAWSYAISAEPPVPLWAQMQGAVLKQNSVAEVRRILDQGFDPNTPIGCGTYTALFGAVKTPNVEMAKLLIERGAKIRDAYVHSLCNGNMDLEMIKLLVAHGGNVNAKDEFGSSCLHAAAYWENVPLLKFLLTCPGLDLNPVATDGGSLDGTPLMWALQRGKDGAAIAALLLKAGADPKVRGKSGITAEDIVRQRMEGYQWVWQRIGSSGAPALSATP